MKLNYKSPQQRYLEEAATVTTSVEIHANLKREQTNTLIVASLKTSNRPSTTSRPRAHPTTTPVLSTTPVPLSSLPPSPNPPKFTALTPNITAKNGSAHIEAPLSPVSVLEAKPSTRAWMTASAFTWASRKVCLPDDILRIFVYEFS